MMFPVTHGVADNGEHLYHLGPVSIQQCHSAGHPETHDSHCVDVGTRFPALFPPLWAEGVLSLLSLHFSKSVTLTSVRHLTVCIVF